MALEVINNNNNLMEEREREIQTGLLLNENSIVTIPTLSDKGEQAEWKP